MENKREERKDLWNRYLMLTEEMAKFLKEDNVDMFLNLMEQRTILHDELQKNGIGVFERSSEGKILGAKIQKVNADIQYKAQIWLNHAKGQERKVNAYSSLGYGDDRFGGNLNYYK